MKQWGLVLVLCAGVCIGIPLAWLPRSTGPLPDDSPITTTHRESLSVTVDSIPPHVAISVDGERRGRTPLVLRGHDQDVFEITLQAANRPSLHRFLVLRTGQARQVLRLEPADAPPPPVAVRPTPAPLPHAVVTVLPTVQATVRPADQGSHGESLSLDDRARQLPESYAQTVHALATALTAGLHRPEDKARVIFVWVATHIRYDVDAFFAHRLLDTHPESVLAARSAVCGGYAHLYSALALDAGLESKIIIGNGKGLEDLRPSQRRTNHAWNAVRIDGQWRLLDVTWGGGSVDRQHRFVPQLEEFFFLTPPEQLVYTHFPDDPQWQCLSRPIGWSDYQTLPGTDPPFWKCGLALDSPRSGRIDTDQEADMRVTTPTTAVLMGGVEDGDGIHNDWVFSQRDGADYVIRAIFPHAGQYKVRIFARRDSDGQAPFDGAVSFEVTAHRGDPNRSFPTIYRDFVADKAYLFEPLDGHLPTRQPQRFKLRVPGAQAVSVLCGSQWFPLEGQADTWSGTISVRPGAVYVIPIYPGETSHRSILKYLAD